jgi:hypothetical protein
MAITYEPIATTTLGTALQTSVTFSTISGSYTDLVLIANITTIHILMHLVYYVK